MSHCPRLADLALRVDELLLRPECMATTRALVEACLASPEEGHADAIQFPDNPDEPFPCDDRTPLTVGQRAVALAALHDVYCPNVERVVPIAPDQPVFDADGKVRGDYYRNIGWRAILDRVEKLGDYAVDWFTLQLRRFEVAPTPTTPSGDDSSTPSTQTAKQPVPAAEANILVRQWLREHGVENPDKVTIRAVVQGTGVSLGGVQKTLAWAAFVEERNRRRGGETRVVRLSEPILVNKPDDGEDGPGEVASQNEDEETWREILHGAESSEERARLADMPDDRRQELIAHYRQQRRDAAADRRERSRRS